ncbi:MAG: acetyl-CoA C-acetyltransferase [Hyphomicrobiaceae bacterium]|nr:acetyl-CoA C-acetyltransferase [Hyphomicrobiaceae bacterium]MCC0025115.1 acetyl-CoA C-acetyltransferase [Hyphomicrobiaceae bacterium]
MTEQAVIVAARRTAIGNLNGALSALPAHALGQTVIGALLEMSGIGGKEVDQVILGQVLTGGQGMNPARQAARGAGIADDATAFGINQVCGSGLRAIMLGAQQVMLGEADIVIAGGQESMSQAPHVAHLRPGKKLGDLNLIDTVMRDGLTDAFYGYAMGVTAENVARKYGIARQDQDEFALQSQMKAADAQEHGRFADEIAGVTIKTRKGESVVDSDEFIRADTSLDALLKLKPVFDPEGSVTAGNASGINDGAAAVVVMSDKEAARRGLSPIARIAGMGLHGLDPALMGLGPIGASRKAVKQAGWLNDAVDLWELNEAFAAQALAVVQDLEIDPERVNVNGGAIALGHPIGASGARILVTLIHEMMRRDARKGVASLCIGGGMGVAMCLER